MKKVLQILTFTTLISMLMFGCKPEPQKPDDKKGVEKVKAPVNVNFNPDSAYQYIAEQVAFGPRVPGTQAHNRALMYLRKKLDQYCDTAFINSGDITTRNGKKFLINNVIGSFNLESKYRVVLAAHWDTRPIADEDFDNPKTPADGANDGASGVGVLIEIARQLQIQRPNIGIDIIFFDQEDGGDREGGPESWCLGSQFWGKWVKDHKYEANAGILLDMVGAQNATFALEGHSTRYNQRLMLDVWKTGQNLGYGAYFVNINGGLITDDHVYMNTVAGIPSIDIIHYDLTTETRFPPHWHTHDDNMSVIDKYTLKAVGHTVLHHVSNMR